MRGPWRAGPWPCHHPPLSLRACAACTGHHHGHNRAAGSPGDPPGGAWGSTPTAVAPAACQQQHPGPRGLQQPSHSAGGLPQLHDRDRPLFSKISKKRGLVIHQSLLVFFFSPSCGCLCRHHKSPFDPGAYGFISDVSPLSEGGPGRQLTLCGEEPLPVKSPLPASLPTTSPCLATDRGRAGWGSPARGCAPKCKLNLTQSPPPQNGRTLLMT